MDVTIRRLTPADLGEADQLRAELGWNQTISDWRRFLALAPDGCFGAERNGKIVGTCTSVCFGDELAWIGMMMVHPAGRGQGIGGRLLRCCVDYLRQLGVRCIKLDATPMGQPIYNHIGFLPECTLTRWEHHGPLPGAEPSSSIQILTEKHWPAVLALDFQNVGIPRASLLRSLAGTSLRALVYVCNGSLLGFGMLRSGARANYLGPIVGGAGIGELLVRSLLSRNEDRFIFWDVPDLNEPASLLASRLGFTPARPLTRMYLDANMFPANFEGYWAIADPATG
jgi:GNAT superfamily N-acetyltransferase